MKRPAEIERPRRQSGNLVERVTMTAKCQALSSGFLLSNRLAAAIKSTSGIRVSNPENQQNCRATKRVGAIVKQQKGPRVPDRDAHKEVHKREKPKEKCYELKRYTDDASKAGEEPGAWRRQWMMGKQLYLHGNERNQLVDSPF